MSRRNPTIDDRICLSSGLHDAVLSILFLFEMYGFNFKHDTDDRRSGAPAIWGKVKIFQSKEEYIRVEVCGIWLT